MPSFACFKSMGADFCADISDLVVLVRLPDRVWFSKVGLQVDADVFTQIQVTFHVFKSR